MTILAKITPRTVFVNKFVFTFMFNLWRMKFKLTSSPFGGRWSGSVTDCSLFKIKCWKITIIMTLVLSLNDSLSGLYNGVSTLIRL